MRRYRIGRAETNDIVLADATISREHAELAELGGGRFRVRDLGSSYGISVWRGADWEKVSEAELRHDAQLRLGEYETTIADLLRDAERTVVRPRASEPVDAAPPEPAPMAEEVTAPVPPPDVEASAARASPAEAPPVRPKPPPPKPPPPAFQFLRDLPPDKRILVWLGAGFAGFLLVSLITLILALAL